MKVEVDIPVDEIVRQVIVDDWRGLKASIDNLKRQKEFRKLEEFEKQDIRDWKKYKKAYETVIRYNYEHTEAEIILGD